MIKTQSDLNNAMAQAAADGWTFAPGDSPPAGERVECMHILARDYDCHGERDGTGQWHCSNGFILPDMKFTFSPTHWRRNGKAS